MSQLILHGVSINIVLLSMFENTNGLCFVVRTPLGYVEVLGCGVEAF